MGKLAFDYNSNFSSTISKKKTCQDNKYMNGESISRPSSNFSNSISADVITHNNNIRVIEIEIFFIITLHGIYAE